MRFDHAQQPLYGGIALHARRLYGAILPQDGESLLHRNMHASPATFRTAIAPYRAAMVVAVAGLFTWDWLADLGAQAGIPFVLGHARSMQALPGGQAHNDTLDAHKIAGGLRGGRLPQAAVSPAERRATRDLRRRRRSLTRQRAELLAHRQPTTSPSQLPELGKTLAYQANRAGGAERDPAPAVPKHMAVALALLGA